MSDSPKFPISDVLGLKPVGEAINKVTESALSFLDAVCKPVAEEYGLMFQDKVRRRRILNMIDMVNEAQRKYEHLHLPPGSHADPRLIFRILEEGSWTDDESLRDMWSGLLASSCSPDGQDDSNLIFVHLLSQMTKSQARILNHYCVVAEKYLSANQLDLVGTKEIIVPTDDLKAISGTHDLQILDAELDHLRSINLLTESGFLLIPEADVALYSAPAIYPEGALDQARIRPSSLALNMFVRCQGASCSVAEYFKLS